MAYREVTRYNGTERIPVTVADSTHFRHPLVTATPFFRLAVLRSYCYIYNSCEPVEPIESSFRMERSGEQRYC